VGSERVSIEPWERARWTVKSARVADESRGYERINGADGISDIEGKAAREAVSERSRRDASDIDGQTERSKWAGAHESTWATSEFQFGNSASIREKCAA
jgi:hypothetical protein